MKRRQSGFTLIELLIVVAIIGILSSLLLPNIQVAIQKSKQKTCMSDIMFIATGCADYIVDHGSWGTIEQNGPLSNSGAFVDALYTFRLRQFPINDPWGNPFSAYVGAAAVASSVSGIPAGDCGEDDFLIRSFGRDHEPGPLHTTFNPGDLEAGIYGVTTVADFDEDLVNWSGSWIIAPRVAKKESET